jgi:hypothetical protein
MPVVDLIRLEPQLPDSFEEAKQAIYRKKRVWSATLTRIAPNLDTQGRAILFVKEEKATNRYPALIKFRALFASNPYSGTIYALINDGSAWGLCTYTEPDKLAYLLRTKGCVWIGDFLQLEYGYADRTTKVYEQWIAKLTSP